MPQAQTTTAPKRLPLVTAPSNRDNDPTKDARLVNCYAEKALDGDYWIYKRPGLLTDSTPPGSASAGLGIFRWLGNTYSIFGSTVYKNGVALAGSVDTTNGVYRFSSCLGTQLLVFGNGVKAYTCDGTTVTVISDPNFPASFVKGWAYLDGTMYVMNTTAHVLGSAINNPTSWDPLNTITAQIEPDLAVGLEKQLVYVVAFKQWTTEIFYDQQNVPPSSPLGPVQGAKLDYGCISADSIRILDGTLFWLSTNRTGSAQVMALNNLKVDVISTPAIERLLDDSSYVTIYSWTHKDEGHKFYILTLVNLNLTLAYDIGQQLWSQWTDVNGNYLPIVDSCTDAVFEHLVQHATDGKLYKFDTEYFGDDYSIITADIITPNFDGGIDRRKTLSRMHVAADQTPGSVLKVRYNDNDYDPVKWSNFRDIDLSRERPFLQDMGTFSRRAFHFRHQSNTRLRIKAVDLQLDIGTL